jgi:hypothetical protein
LKNQLNQATIVAPKTATTKTVNNILICALVSGFPIKKASGIIRKKRDFCRS